MIEKHISNRLFDDADKHFDFTQQDYEDNGEKVFDRVFEFVRDWLYTHEHTDCDAYEYAVDLSAQYFG